MRFSSDKKISFPGKDANETVYAVVRRHWITYVGHIFINLLLFVVPLILILVLLRYLPISMERVAFPYAQIVFLGTCLYYLAIGTYAMIDFMNYYLDAWIITNKRIVAIEQKSLFNRVTSELALYNVQDITIESKGVFATMLKFGTLFVQTAGKQHRFTFEMVPQVHNVKEKMNDLVENAVRQEKIKTTEGNGQPDTARASQF
jgi:hypothetical protein